MVYKTLNVQLNSQSIQSAINALKARQRSLQIQFAGILESLAMLARDVAQDHFGSAVMVDYYPKEPSLEYTITANGRAVGFFEFGAGTMVNETHPLKDNAPFPVYPGSYSEQNAHEFELQGFWTLGGVRYSFVFPRRGLYYASEAIKEQADKVIRSSFK